MLIDLLSLQPGVCGLRQTSLPFVFFFLSFLLQFYQKTSLPMGFLQGSQGSSLYSPLPLPFPSPSRLTSGASGAGSVTLNSFLSGVPCYPPFNKRYTLTREPVTRSTRLQISSELKQQQQKASRKMKAGLGKGEMWAGCA
ncbi:hypothetical protein HJG60_008491 [Phyllostomus discolor]|uniref:Uncharacterized protein n=1 Tax=Phyllostomus discolor TaxID=89673 RepID=A0A834DNF0_9CHIR|nr:hypothetical protein HJG60_008491 [Phyllostomus discolor]